MQDAFGHNLGKLVRSCPHCLQTIAYLLLGGIEPPRPRKNAPQGATYLLHAQLTQNLLSEPVNTHSKRSTAGFNDLFYSLSFPTFETAILAYGPQQINTHCRYFGTTIFPVEYNAEGEERRFPESDVNIMVTNDMNCRLSPSILLTEELHGKSFANIRKTTALTPGSRGRWACFGRQDSSGKSNFSKTLRESNSSSGVFPRARWADS